jgi:P4 family phage/plasmid primase-like protien
LAQESPTRLRREKISAQPLPQAKSLASHSREVRTGFQQHVSACLHAKEGTRSEIDFGACMYAISQGITSDSAWEQLQRVGKFATRDREYFDGTWNNAMARVQKNLYEEWEEQERKFGLAKMDRAQLRRDGLPATLSHMIRQRSHLAQGGEKRLYHYLEGTYHEEGEEFLQRECRRICEQAGIIKRWRPAIGDQVVREFRLIVPRIWDRPPLDVINVKNGLLDVRTLELKPHRPDFLSPTQLPVVYDPEAQCPQIDKFIEEVFPADAVELAYEIAAHLIIPDTSKQKAVLLSGVGGNGKSVYLRLLTALLGSRNTSSLPLHRLEADRFAVSCLLGKLANICSDLPGTTMQDSAVFKSITGGDELTGEFKFLPQFKFVPFARLLFSSNVFPQSKDTSPAFFDRWVVVPMEREIRGASWEIPQHILDARLQQPAELSGLLNRALGLLEQVRGGFSRPRSAELALERFKLETDPVGLWLDQYTLDDPDSITPCSKLKNDLNDYLRARKMSPVSAETIGRSLRKLRPRVKKERQLIDGVKKYCYSGIALLHRPSRAWNT